MRNFTNGSIDEDTARSKTAKTFNNQEDLQDNATL